MANLKEIRNRITSVNSTKQITSAMKMVSAAKLKRAQDSITQMRPYAEKLTEILGNLSASLDTSENVYAQQRDIKKVLLVPISSNRGLCGAFNANIFKAARDHSENYGNTHVEVLALGKKAGELLHKREYRVREINTGIFDDLNYSAASEIAESLMKAFEDKEYDEVVLVYNQFKNAAAQNIMVEQFLPVVMEEGGESSGDYIFEPSKEEIVEQLIPHSLKTQLFKALLDSNASEHGARMTAMHKATDNATELVKDLKLTYNKLRQASITNEILEIVGGAEALNG
jgi:F-type H+-transporting ATPase subunit gamma